MGPFLHQQGHAAERREHWVAALIQNISAAVGNRSSITLTLSDFPFDVVSNFLEQPSLYLSDWVGKPSNASLVDTLRYTNRAPPNHGAWADGATLTDYLAVLKRLRVLLGPMIDYEIGNEPNALGYFWGNAADYQPIAEGTIRALGDPSLQRLPTRVTCCAFATEMSCQNLSRGSDDGFIDLAQRVALRQRQIAGGKFPTALSWHFYRRVSHDTDPQRSTYANATAFYGREALRGSVISEWGLSTYNSAEASVRINSPSLMLELVRMLVFAADVNLAEVDAHCLMDDPHKDGHDCFFDRASMRTLPYCTPFNTRTVAKVAYLLSKAKSYCHKNANRVVYRRVWRAACCVLSLLADCADNRWRIHGVRRRFCTHEHQWSGEWTRNRCCGRRRRWPRDAGWHVCATTRTRRGGRIERLWVC